MKPHHLIFEGPELAGKSWIMSEVYKKIEAKYGKSDVRLDGCHWINCDFGLFGTNFGRPAIDAYISILENLKEQNVMIEKFHLSDIVLNRLHAQTEVDYTGDEYIMENLGYKIVLVTFKEDEALIRKRIEGRMKLYPHCRRVIHEPADYIAQQREYLNEIKKSKLPHLIIETGELPDFKPVREILTWIGEDNSRFQAL